MGQCTAKSKRTGERCKRMCAPGKNVCKIHGGASTGPPKGSKNNLKHGAYETISIETMYPEEIEYANSVSMDPIETLKEQIRILRVKERRIAVRMKKALDAEGVAGQDDGQGKKHPATVLLSVSTVQTQNFLGEQSKTVTSSSEAHSMWYLRLEQAHTTVLDQIRRAMSNLAQLEESMGVGDELLPLYTLPPEGMEDAK